MDSVRRIVIVDYRPEWPEAFAALERKLCDALGDLAVRIDHIGSTAVRGLAAKNVIDVQVTVEDLTREMEVAFETGGFTMLEYTQDHKPPTETDTGSDRDWEKRLFRSEADPGSCNVHVRRAGSRNGRYALLFRDYLRAQPLAMSAYAQVKKALAAHDPTDWDHYYDVKDPVCDIIMAGAEDWAATSGWRIEHY